MTNGQIIYVTPPKPRRRRIVEKASMLPMLVIGGVAVYFLAKKFCWLPDYIACDTATPSTKTQSIVQYSSPSLHVESKNPVHSYLT